MLKKKKVEETRKKKKCLEQCRACVKNYMSTLKINFLLWNSFRFIEKFQREYRVPLYSSPSFPSR